MPSKNLFNRNMKFTIIAKERVGGGERQLFSFTKNNIQASIDKAADTEVSSSGTISVSNMKREQVEFLIVPGDPKIIIYELLAGYGQADDLFLVSRGVVSNLSFAHTGGELRVDFTVIENLPSINAPWGSIETQHFAKGTSLLSIISTLKGKEVIISVDQNTPEIQDDLSQQKIAEDIKIDGNVQNNLNDIMDQYGHKVVTKDLGLVITSKATPSNNAQDTRQLREPTERKAVTELNFQTGLLEASTEILYDQSISYSVAMANFKTLFIPYIAPLSYVRINEPTRYKNLSGVYFVKKTTLTLNNYTGPFFISGVGVPATGEYIQKLQAEKLFRLAGDIKRDITEIGNQFGFRLP